MSFSAPTSRAQRSRRILPWLLYLYALVLFAMHFVRIFDNSFWGDEGFTIRLAKMDFVDMVIATAKDVHPPLYYFFTQILCRIFGFHGFTYHLSAVIPYGILLVLCCTVIRKWFGLIPAAIVVTLSSLTDAAITYNVEARMYSLAALFVLVAYLAFYQIYQKNRLMDWFLFGFSSLCAAYTHYYALISVAFFYLMLLPLLWRGKEYRKRIIWLYGGTVFSYIFWLYVLLKTFKRTNGSWWMTSIATFSECFDFVWGYKWLAVLAFALFFTATVLILKQFFRSHTLPDESILFLAGSFSIFGTILVGIAVSYLSSPLIIPRYLFPLAPVAYLMLSRIIQRLPYQNLIACSLIVILLVSGVPTYWAIHRHEQEIERGTQICTELFASSEDPILYTNDVGWNFEFNAENLFPSIPYVDNDEALSSLTDTHKDIWVLWSRPLSSEETAQILNSGFSIQEVFSGYAFHDLFTGKFMSDPVYTIFHLYKLEAHP